MKYKYKVCLGPIYVYVYESEDLLTYVNELLNKWSAKLEDITIRLVDWDSRE